MMITLDLVLLAVTAVAHLAFFAIEMFPWAPRPFVFRLVKLPFEPREENETAAAAIVHNAGLYNAFLAAGLIWSIFAEQGAFELRLFFLSCAAIAGVFGAFTLTYKTLLMQTLPAVAALVVLFISR